MAKSVPDYKNSCFVDETIVNDKEVIYGALFLNNYPPSTVGELKSFVKKNIHKVKNPKKREKFLVELKSTFFSTTSTVGEAKKLINRSEIKSFTRYSSKNKMTELENREVALSELIRKVQCKNIYVDDYRNANHRKSMIDLGRKNNKNVYFVDSEVEPGIQLADALHKLW